MDDSTRHFCDSIRQRSNENRLAIRSFPQYHEVLSPAFSILRQELDSLVRVIFLLNIEDLAERRRLFDQTLGGEQWTVQTPKGKWKRVTDREMVEASRTLQNWTLSVYKFGCAFIHLSDYHGHLAEDPFNKLCPAEKQDILTHMRCYHGGPQTDEPDIAEIARYVPRIFEKIADNLECYIKMLELDKTLGEDN